MLLGILLRLLRLIKGGSLDLWWHFPRASITHVRVLHVQVAHADVLREFAIISRHVRASLGLDLRNLLDSIWWWVVLGFTAIRNGVERDNAIILREHDGLRTEDEAVELGRFAQVDRVNRSHSR